VLAVLLLACVGAAAGATWVVDDEGGANFTSIQAAVDAANGGGAARGCERDECLTDVDWGKGSRRFGMRG